MSITTHGWGSGSITTHGWGSIFERPIPPVIPGFDDARLWIVEIAANKLQVDALSKAPKADMNVGLDRLQGKIQDLLDRIRSLEHEIMEIVGNDKELEAEVKREGLEIEFPYERPGPAQWMHPWRFKKWHNE
jgi:hypothetical protein